MRIILGPEQLKGLGSDGPVYWDVVDTYAMVLNADELRRTGGKMKYFRMGCDASVSLLTVSFFFTLELILQFSK